MSYVLRPLTGYWFYPYSEKSITKFILLTTILGVAFVHNLPPIKPRHALLIILFYSAALKTVNEQNIHPRESLKCASLEPSSVGLLLPLPCPALGRDAVPHTSAKC